MDSKFKRLVDQLPGLLKSLENSSLRHRNDLSGIPGKGVYVFFERGKPIYVGRSNNLKERILTHSRPSSGHGSATFAFLMAKRAAKRKRIDLSKQRVHLEKDRRFADLYAKAKKRISKMSVKVIRVNDPILQTLFEVYAAVALGTRTYNDFDTH